MGLRRRSRLHAPPRSVIHGQAGSKRSLAPPATVNGTPDRNNVTFNYRSPQRRSIVNA
jgi:hypothetical protein